MSRFFFFLLFPALLSAAWTGRAGSGPLTFRPGLEGSPEEIGAAFASLLGEAGPELAAHRDQLFGQLPPEERARRLRLYSTLLETYAPNWLAESRAVSLALGWQPDEYLLYNVILDDKLACSSWILTPEANRLGKMILHKNRDSSTPGLGAWFRHSAGFYRFLSIGDRWSYSSRFAVNEKGLALIMNAGDGNSIPRPEAGFKAPDTLAFLAERCSTAAEAAAWLEELIAAGKYADEGTIYFFLDSEEAIIAEGSPNRMVAIPVAFGFDLRANHWKFPGMVSLSERNLNNLLIENRREYFIRNFLRQAMKKAGGIELADIRRLSRSRDGSAFSTLQPVCRDSTVSAATIVPDAEFPAELTTVYLALGPVRNTIYLPLPLAVTELPTEFFNGEWGAAGFELRRQLGVDHEKLSEFEAFEAQLDFQYDQTAAEARVLLRQGERQAAVELLNANFRRQAQQAWEWLQIKPNP